MVITKTYAPLMRLMAFLIPPSIPREPCWQIKFNMDSESLVVWNITPSSVSISRKLSALTKFPLWASAISPSLHEAARGCALLTLPSPAVEYLTWPIAMFPGKFAKVSPLKTSPASPKPFLKSIEPLLLAAIPALSCPLCCKA